METFVGHHMSEEVHTLVTELLQQTESEYTSAADLTKLLLRVIAATSNAILGKTAANYQLLLKTESDARATEDALYQRIECLDGTLQRQLVSIEFLQSKIEMLEKQLDETTEMAQITKLRMNNEINWWHKDRMDMAFRRMEELYGTQLILYKECLTQYEKLEEKQMHLNAAILELAVARQ